MMRCPDCRVDTSFGTGIGHYYTVHATVWRQAWQGSTRAGAHLCLDCLEKRLRRPVSEADFMATPPEILARFAGRAT